MSEQDSRAVEHLQCEQCDSNPTVARIGGAAKLVCHCTHVGGNIDPVDVDSMALLPDPWRFADA